MFNFIVDKYDGETLSQDKNNKNNDKQPFISSNSTTTTEANEETRKVHIRFWHEEKDSENLEMEEADPKIICFACHDWYNNNK